MKLTLCILLSLICIVASAQKPDTLDPYPIYRSDAGGIERRHRLINSPPKKSESDTIQIFFKKWALDEIRIIDKELERLNDAEKYIESLKARKNDLITDVINERDRIDPKTDSVVSTSFTGKAAIITIFKRKNK